jgi:branched-subunit amino acid ABC-type transport system permease component
VLGLDHYASFLLSAFGITVVVLLGYALYLRSRLMGVRRRAASADSQAADYSGRNVSAAATRVTAAQAASSANGPSTS